MQHDPEHIGKNSASRLYKILNAARDLSRTQTAIHVWCQIFDIQEEDPVRQAREVTTRLLHLQDELEKTELAIEQEDMFEKEDYEEEFAAVRKVLNTAAIRDQWAIFRDMLGPEVLQTLRLFGRQLPADTEPAPTEDIDELLTLIQELEDAVRESSEDPELKTFLYTLVDIMRRAVREYPLRGAKAFRTAAYDIRVEIEENADTVRRATATQEFGLLKRAWAKFLQVGEMVERVHRGLKAGVGVVQILSGVAQDLNLPMPDPEPPQLPPGSVEVPPPRNLG